MALRAIRRRLRDLATAFSVILAAAVAAAALQTVNQQSMAGRAQVIDGDTLRLDDRRIRLYGIDAPERDQICHDASGAARRCGRLAADHLTMLVGGRAISCTGSDDDRYGRVLGICRKGGDEAGRSINETMVADGWALAYGSYRAAERRARAQGRGLWAFTFDRPQDWRQMTHHDDQARSSGDLAALVRRTRAWIGLGGHNE